MAASPRSANPSLRERVGALRNLPPFLREIWATSRALTMTSLGLRLVRALVPIATLYVGKLIIDEAVHLVGQGLGFDTLREAWRSGALDHLVVLIVAEFGLAILSDLLARMVSYADVQRGDRHERAHQAQPEARDRERAARRPDLAQERGKVAQRADAFAQAGIGRARGGRLCHRASVPAAG